MANNYINPLNTRLDADQTIIRAYDEANNRHRVDAQVTATIGSVDVIIDAASGDNIAIEDFNGNVLTINPDGSLDVNTVINASTDNIAIADASSGNKLNVNADGSINTSLIVTGINKIYQNSITSVPTNIETTILTYTVPAITTSYLQRITTSGTTIGQYFIKLNGTLLTTKRSYFGDLNPVFEFTNDPSFTGYNLISGQILTISIIHARPTGNDFDTSLQVVEI